MIIAGTGHRPNKLGGYDPHATLIVTQVAHEALVEYKPSLIISGMAQGWDMALAQAAIQLNIPFHAYIPCVGQETVWPNATQLYYKALLKKAEKIVICSRGGYAAEKMAIRNTQMVNACEMLLALWDGTPGGTAHCVSYASFVGKPYVNLYPRWLQRTANA